MDFFRSATFKEVKRLGELGCVIQAMNASKMEYIEKEGNMCPELSNKKFDFLGKVGYNIEKEGHNIPGFSIQEAIWK